MVCLISVFLSGCDKTPNVLEGIKVPETVVTGISEATDNCQKVTRCGCSIIKDEDGKLIVSIDAPTGDYSADNLVKDTEKDPAPLWAGIFGTGLAANWGGQLNNYYWWPQTLSYGTEISGVNPTLVKKLEIIIFDRRETKERINEYGKTITPAKTERKIKRKIILIPGNAAKFDWKGGHISDVWGNVKKEAKASMSIETIKTPEWVTE